MCDRKYLIGDRSKFGSSKNGQNMPKKRSTRKNTFCTLNKDQLTTLLM